MAFNNERKRGTVPSCPQGHLGANGLVTVPTLRSISTKETVMPRKRNTPSNHVDGRKRTTGRKVAILEQAVLHHRRFCRSCGTPIPLNASKAVGLCAKCRRYCVSCGKATSNYGHYGVCTRCVGAVNLTAQYIEEHDGKLPPEAEDTTVQGGEPESVNCECGDPATHKYQEGRYCDECYAEKIAEAELVNA